MLRELLKAKKDLITMLQESQAMMKSSPEIYPIKTSEYIEESCRLLLEVIDGTHDVDVPPAPNPDTSIELDPAKYNSSFKSKIKFRLKKIVMFSEGNLNLIAEEHSESFKIIAENMMELIVYESGVMYLCEKCKGRIRRVSLIQTLNSSAECAFCGYIKSVPMDALTIQYQIKQKKKVGVSPKHADKLKRYRDLTKDEIAFESKVMAREILDAVETGFETSKRVTKMKQDIRNLISPAYTTIKMLINKDEVSSMFTIEESKTIREALTMYVARMKRLQQKIKVCKTCRHRYKAEYTTARETRTKDACSICFINKATLELSFEDYEEIK